MIRLVTCCLLVATLGGCAQKKQVFQSVPVAAHRSEPGQVLIRSGSLDLRAKDLGVAKGQIESIVQEVEGRVQDWSFEEGKWLNVTLRVPESRLEEAMDRVSRLGKVVGRSLRSRDVTDELIDLEARVKNLRALRDRLRTYLDKATNLEEILAVERELARVQTELESIEAKLKVLNEQVAMSELDVRARQTRWL